ncbi:MAG: hypothetical protein V4598_13870 [Bdellovibrionota bacterium]
MRSVFLKLALFILAVYLPWFAIVKFARHRYVADDFASWMKFSVIEDDQKKFNPPHIAVGDCLLLAGMLPEKIDQKVFNLGMSGATPIEAYFLLKHYLASGKKPERVYLMFGMTHFQLADSFQEYTLAYGRLTVGDELTLMNDIRIHGSPEIGKPHWTKTWIDSGMTFLGLDSVTSVQMRKRLFTPSYKFIQNNLDTMALTRGQHHFRDESLDRFQPAPFVDYDHLSLNPLITHYFRKTLDMLQDAGIETIVDFIPNNIVTWKKFSPRFHQEWQDYRKQLKRDYPRITLGDISHYPPEMFGDHSHMNAEGAEKFSLAFKKQYYQ